MPIQYDGIPTEHTAVRTDAGVFDVSHMGQIEVSGPAAATALQHLLSNDVDDLEVGRSQYSVLCQPDGGVIDDLIAYRLADDEYLLIVNASNQAGDLSWVIEHGEPLGAEITDRSSDYAMLAVQGPQARAKLASIATTELPERGHVGTVTIAGVDCLGCGTGYTGEDGLELLVPADAATSVWDAVISVGVKPIGLGARDTLRLEACLPLYGNELSLERDPIAAGLGWCCKEKTGFIGADAIAAVRDRDPEQKLVPFTIDGPGIARQGNPIVEGGEVTSGTMSPTLGIGIGLAYVKHELASTGTRLSIDVRGRERHALVADRPLHRSKEKRLVHG
jgi:aminomethyltransferase